MIAVRRGAKAGFDAASAVAPELAGGSVASSTLTSASHTGGPHASPGRAIRQVGPIAERSDNDGGHFDGQIRG